MAKPGKKPTPTCAVENCNMPKVKRAWCNKHYRRWLRHGDPTKTKYRKFCEVDGCGGVHVGHGYCRKHMARMERNGSHNIKYKTKEYVCDYCGKVFERPLKYRSKYCSLECNRKGNYRNRKLETSVACCENCGKMFSIYPDIHQSKYCSQKCVGIVSAIKRLKCVECSVCGGTLTTANAHLDICKKCSYEKRIRRTVKRNARRKALRRGAEGPTHTEIEWQALLLEHDNKCAYCQKADAEHRDHVMPIFLGGADAIDNILPACALCNLQKGAMHPDKWFEKINNKEVIL